MYVDEANSVNLYVVCDAGAIVQDIRFGHSGGKPATPGTCVAHRLSLTFVLKRPLPFFTVT